MGPMPPVDHNALEQQLKDTIQSLHNIMVQVTAYDTTLTNSSSSPPLSSATSSPAHHGYGSRSSRDALATELSALSRSLQGVSRTAGTRALPQVPPELVQYVDNGRNPDVYTREFVELVRRGNQLMRGKQQAFAAFRDVLARQIESAMPELALDAERVLAATGGGGGDSTAGAGANAGTGK
ncbi:mediator complex, subunit Med10 [Nemania sp. FL0916]|nr:mediator complex, subunit Med10 [Nemania sp. FL0916]